MLITAQTANAMAAANLRQAKALTIWQPYASFLACGDKPYETRDWATKYRGPIYIHAGAKQYKKGSPEARFAQELLERSKLPYERVEDLPRGCFIARAILADCHKIDQAFFDGLTEWELMTGDYRLGRYAWEFTDMEPLSAPIIAPGMKGLWNL